MAIDLSPVAAPEARRTTPMPEPSFDERWAAWLARGAAHDRAVRRKVAVAAPILIIVAVLTYVLLRP
jgi:hypothetical protein